MPTRRRSIEVTVLISIVPQVKYLTLVGRETFGHCQSLSNFAEITKSMSVVIATHLSILKVAKLVMSTT